MASKANDKGAQEQSGENEKVEFPEFPDLKPDEIKSMSHEDKLKLIEREAKTLYDFCVEKGLSKKDLSWCLKPLFGSPPELVKKVVKDNSKFFTTFAVIGCLLAIVFGWSTAYNLVCVHGKLALMKALPYWDWTYLYDQDCVVKNPFVTPERNLTKEDCQACLDLSKNGIEGLSNASHDLIANDFLLVDFPAIIEDGTKEWPNPNFDLNSLSQEYLNHKDLDSTGDCRFRSSIDNITNVYDFFKAYESKSLPDAYFALWDNCDLKAAKHFRLNYKRPYYLPPMAEAAKVNSFFITKGKSDEAIGLSGEDDSSGMWLTVVSGKLTVDIVPVEGCGKFKGCKMISNELKKGEALVAPLRLWQVDASSLYDGETIAIGSTMTWDEGEGLPAEDEEQEDRAQKEAPQDEPQDESEDGQNNGPSDDSQDDPGDEQSDDEQSDDEPIDKAPIDDESMDDGRDEPSARPVDGGKSEHSKAPVDGTKDGGD